MKRVFWFFCVNVINMSISIFILCLKIRLERVIYCYYEFIFFRERDSFMIIVILFLKFNYCCFFIKLIYWYVFRECNIMWNVWKKWFFFWFVFSVFLYNISGFFYMIFIYVEKYLNKNNLEIKVLNGFYSKFIYSKELCF